MQCFHPIKVRLPTGEMQEVSCGKCYACQSKRRKEWYFRLKTEMKHSLSSYTVTLTYDEEHIPTLIPYYEKDAQGFKVKDLETGEDKISFWYNPVSPSDIQSYHHRLRKKYKFRYFCVLEYGSHTNRPHAHIIYFFNQPIDRTKFNIDVIKAWQKGVRITIDTTDDKCINYTSKYLFKPYKFEQPKPIMLCSKRPFIGFQHIPLNSNEKISFYLQTLNDVSEEFGTPQRLPRIYRDRFFIGDFKDLITNRHVEELRKTEESDRIHASDLGTTYEALLKGRKAKFIEQVNQQIIKKQL